MPNPSDLNALYQEWLEIPADRLPPNHYALLGLADFESDEGVIEAAAKARSAYLHQIASGPRRKIVQQMLGNVAVARRTLMSATARSEYDQTLRSDSDADRAEGVAELPADQSDPIESLDAPVALANQSSFSESPSPAEDAPPPKPSRRHSGQWKYHAISAAVLLAIVGVIYWVNRGTGGRRAAEVGAAKTRVAETVMSNSVADSDTAEDDSSAASGSSASDEESRPSSPRKANARKVPMLPGGSAAMRRSPIARRRDTGSGLGSGLGDKFADVLSDIAKQPQPLTTSAGGNSDDQETFQPLGGMAIGEVSSQLDDADLPVGLTAVDEFPAKLASRFACPQGFDWFGIEEQKLRIKTASPAEGFVLTDQQFELTAGSAIAVTTSLDAKMQSETRVAFVFDGIQIGIRPTDVGLQVFVIGKGDQATVDTVSKITTSSKSNALILARNVEDADSINWFVLTDQESQSGTIGRLSLGEAPPVGVLVAAPSADSKGGLWLSDLKVRSLPARRASE